MVLFILVLIHLGPTQSYELIHLGPTQSYEVCVAVSQLIGISRTTKIHKTQISSQLILRHYSLSRLLPLFEVYELSYLPLQ